MNKIRLAWIAGLALVSGTASATLITIDANDFAAGTDISNVTPGVTLSSIWRAQSVDRDPAAPIELNYAPIFATTCAGGAYNCSTIAGDNVFGHEVHVGWASTGFANEGAAAGYISGELGNHNSFEVFRADFENRTNFAQLIVGGAHNADYPRVDFWDLTGTLIGTCSSADSGSIQSPGCSVANLGDLSSPLPGFREPWLISLASSTNNIAFVTAGGWAGGQYVSQLTFNRVPEPETLGLMIAGAIGIALRRRRPHGENTR